MGYQAEPGNQLGAINEKCLYILLYVTLFAHKYLVIELPGFAACAFLLDRYFDWYRPIFAGLARNTSTDLAGGEHAL